MTSLTPFAPWTRRRLAFAGAIASVAMSPLAYATTVSPVVIDLKTSGRNVVANVSVENSGATALPVQLTIQELEPTEAGVVATGKDPGDLLVVPAQALINPSQTQTFRVQWVGDPELAKSKHYYITVEQLPVKLPEGQSAVQIVYNFQVLVNVASPNQVAKLDIVSAKVSTHNGKPAPELTVSNSGGAYGYLSGYELKLSERDAAGKEVFAKAISGSEFQQTVGYGLVATGQTRKFVLPIELPATGTTLTATIAPDRAH